MKGEDDRSDVNANDLPKTRFVNTIYNLLNGSNSSSQGYENFRALVRSNIESNKINKGRLAGGENAIGDNDGSGYSIDLKSVAIIELEMWQQIVKDDKLWSRVSNGEVKIMTVQDLFLEFYNKCGDLAIKYGLNIDWLYRHVDFVRQRGDVTDLNDLITMLASVCVGKAGDVNVLLNGNTAAVSPTKEVCNLNGSESIGYLAIYNHQYDKGRIAIPIKAHPHSSLVDFAKSFGELSARDPRFTLDKQFVCEHRSKAMLSHLKYYNEGLLTLYNTRVKVCDKGANCYYTDLYNAIYNDYIISIGFESPISYPSLKQQYAADMLNELGVANVKLSDVVRIIEIDKKDPKYKKAISGWLLRCAKRVGKEAGAHYPVASNVLGVESLMIGGRPMARPAIVDYKIIDLRSGIPSVYSSRDSILQELSSVGSVKSDTASDSQDEKIDTLSSRPQSNAVVLEQQPVLSCIVKKEDADSGKVIVEAPGQLRESGSARRSYGLENSYNLQLKTKSPFAMQFLDQVYGDVTVDSASPVQKKQSTDDRSAALFPPPITAAAVQLPMNNKELQDFYVSSKANFSNLSSNAPIFVPSTGSNIAHQAQAQCTNQPLRMNALHRSNPSIRSASIFLSKESSAASNAVTTFRK